MAEQSDGIMGMEKYPENTDATISDEVDVGQEGTEDERASLELAIEQFPVVGTIIERLMEAAAPPAESPEDTVKANLAPGEFVFTAEAVRNIGVDKLQSMMEKAEEKQAVSQGGKVVDGQEQAFSNGGYVNDEGQRGFVEQMYKQGKATQEKKMHKDSGFNYQDGGVAGERAQYMGRPSKGSILDRLKEATGFFSSTPDEPTIDPRQQFIDTHEEVVKAREALEADPQSSYNQDMLNYAISEADVDWATRQETR